MREVLEFTSYKSFLESAFEERAQQIRGVKSQFAKAVQIQSSYVTKVLSGGADLSLEQADRAADFLGLTDDERHYFLLLVELARAGTDSLRRNFERQIAKFRNELYQQKKAFKAKSGLALEDKHIFYSSWQYAAVLHSLSIPRLNTKEAVAEHFKLPLKRVGEILEFLVTRGMVTMSEGRVTSVQGWDWVSGDATLVARDHSNWRLMAIRAFENRTEKDLHYSSVISISEEDAFRLKQMALKMLEEGRQIIAASKEEKVCSFLIDFFEL